jgi:hypothetical protein
MSAVSASLAASRDCPRDLAVNRLRFKAYRLLVLETYGFQRWNWFAV